MSNFDQIYSIKSIRIGTINDMEKKRIHTYFSIYI